MESSRASPLGEESRGDEDQRPNRATAPQYSSAYQKLQERGFSFTAFDIKVQFQGSVQGRIVFLERLEALVQSMQEGIYYTYNNGKLASDPKLACANFVNALEHIPKVIESHEKEVAKAKADIGVYTAIANGSWKKEDELRSLKTQAAELDRKIALELAPPEPEKEEVNEGEKQEHSQGGEQNTISQGEKQEPAHTLPLNTTTPQYSIPVPKSEPEDRGIMSRVVISKPKWR